MECPVSASIPTPWRLTVAKWNFSEVKDGASFCHCTYALRISRYSSFLRDLPTNTTTFLGGLWLCNSRDLENDFIIKLNAKKVLKLILKTLKKADDVSALPYAIIQSKRWQLKQEYIKRENNKNSCVSSGHNTQSKTIEN